MTRTSFLEHEAQNWTSLVLNMTHGIEPFFQFDSKNGTLFLNMTQRTESFFSKWLKELNLFSQSDAKNCFFFFFSLTRRIEPSFLNMSQWIEPFCRLTHRIEPCFFVSIWLKDLTPLKKYDFQELNLLIIWIKGLNFWKCDSKYWTLFFNMSQRIEPTFPTWVKELIFFFEHDSQKLFKIITQRIDFFSWNMTYKAQRIETSFHTWLEELNLTQGLNFFEETWLTELNHFSCDSRSWTLLSNISQRNWTFSLNTDSKNWTFLFEYWRKELNLFSWIWRKDWSCSLKFWQKKNWAFFFNLTQRIEPSVWIWLKKRTFFFRYAYKNWNPISKISLQELNFVKNMTQRIERFLLFKRNLTQRFFWNSKNGTLFQKYDSKNWTLFRTLRMKLFYKYGLLQEFNPFEPFQMTQRIGPISHDSKNWTFFCTTQRIELFSVSLKEVNFFLHLTQRIEPYWIITQRIESSFSWLKELNLFFFLECDSKNWIFFCDPKNCTFFFECDPKNWNFFVECDPKNWIIVEKC